MAPATAGVRSMGTVRPKRETPGCARTRYGMGTSGSGGRSRQQAGSATPQRPADLIFCHFSPAETDRLFPPERQSGPEHSPAESPETGGPSDRQSRTERGSDEGSRRKGSNGTAAEMPPASGQAFGQRQGIPFRPGFGNRRKRPGARRFGCAGTPPQSSVTERPPLFPRRLKCPQHGRKEENG